MLRTAFHTVFLTDHPVEEAVRMVLGHGYDEVELNAETLPWARPHVGPHTDPATRRKLARLATYSSICAHHADFGAPDEDRRQAAVRWTTELIRLAVDIGTDVVHVIPGEGAELQALYRSLETAVTEAERLDVKLALEPIVNQAISTTEGALAAVNRVPGLLINFDPSHLQVTEQDVLKAADTLGHLVPHVALKDATGDPENFMFVPLGAGKVDFDGMLRSLIAGGYDGVVSVEHESHLFGDERPAEQVLAESKQFVDALLQRVEG